MSTLRETSATIAKVSSASGEMLRELALLLVEVVPVADDAAVVLRTAELVSVVWVDAVEVLAPWLDAVVIGGDELDVVVV